MTDFNGYNNICPWCEKFVQKCDCNYVLRLPVGVKFETASAVLHAKKCECGVDVLGYGQHSFYCPKITEEQQ